MACGCKRLSDTCLQWKFFCIVYVERTHQPHSMFLDTKAGDTSGLQVSTEL